MADLAQKPNCRTADYVEREQKRLLCWGVLILLSFIGFLALNQYKALSLPGDQFGAITAAFVLWIKDIGSSLKGNFRVLSGDTTEPKNGGTP